MGREVVFDAGEGEVSRERSGAGGVLSRHGVAGDAETLIAAVRASNPPALETASAQNVNHDEASRLTSADVKKIAKAQIADFTVRGIESVVYTAYDHRGTLYKGTYELSRPEQTHVSEKSAFAESEIGKALGAQHEAQDEALESGRQAALDQREAALARRERALEEKEREAAKNPDRSLIDPQTGQPIPAGEQPVAGDADATGVTTGDGETPAPPAFLPNDYGEQNASDAAEYAGALTDEAQRAALLAYEQTTKNRKSVRRALGEDVPSGE